MNRNALLVLLLLSTSFAQPIYTLDVDRSGSTSVTLSLESGEMVNVSMPMDAANIRIVGGSYKIDGAVASIQPGASGFTTFSYTTNLFTTKTASGWKFSVSPPNGSQVQIYMPAYATIENTFPQPKAVESEQSRTVIVSDYSSSISVYYHLEDLPQAPQDSGSQYLLFAAGVIAVGAITASFILRGGKSPSQSNPVSPVAEPVERAPSLDMTSGKKEMMETFNENDLTIVNHLIQNEGKSRRNELERKSGISKSSLAMALNRLEKRKIVEIDRTSTTHFVKLSDYFLKL